MSEQNSNNTNMTTTTSLTYDNCINYIVQCKQEGKGSRKIAKELGLGSKSTVNHWYAKYLKDGGVEVKLHSFNNMKKDYDNSCILVISDMHIPYHHKDAFKFLKSIKEKYKPTRIICIGDELDKHSLSYHDHDPDLPSAGDELKISLEYIKQLKTLFPVMDVLESNHGSLVYRKAKTNGIPKYYLKSYNDVLGVGEDWCWHFDLMVDLPNGQKCYFHHGKVAEGIRLSQTMGMNSVQGHFHERFKVDYWGNPVGLFWSMQVGCLADDKSLAFSYNNANLKRPVLGIGLIVNSLPIIEPMILDNNGNWINA